MPKYLVNTPLKTDSGILAPGTEIELPARDAKEAEALLAVGALERVVAQPSAKAKG
jgi:hypothetical protein